MAQIFALKNYQYGIEKSFKIFKLLWFKAAKYIGDIAVPGDFVVVGTLAADKNSIVHLLNIINKIKIWFCSKNIFI